jgi:hypothetical protein
MNKKLLNKYLKEMQKLVLENDLEKAHSEADDLLCCLLETIGYKELVEEYDKVKKWFA